jgi:uncharacterized membrane protein YeaQ/YmgE (transglycosylase-associated protein family)
MGIIAWIVFGALAGWLASILIKTNEDQGIIGNIIVGIIGAVLGGFLFEQLGADPVTGFNFYSLFVAVIGSALTLVAYKFLKGEK